MEVRSILVARIRSTADYQHLFTSHAKSRTQWHPLESTSLLLAQGSRKLSECHRAHVDISVRPPSLYPQLVGIDQMLSSELLSEKGLGWPLGSADLVF